MVTQRQHLGGSCKQDTVSTVRVLIPESRNAA